TSGPASGDAVLRRAQTAASCASGRRAIGSPRRVGPRRRSRRTPPGLARAIAIFGIHVRTFLGPSSERNGSTKRDRPLQGRLPSTASPKADSPRSDRGCFGRNIPRGSQCAAPRGGSEFDRGIIGTEESPRGKKSAKAGSVGTASRTRRTDRRTALL